MSLLRTALFQSSGTPGSVEESLKALDGAAERAAAAGARLLVASELFLAGYVDEVQDLAEAADGPSARAVADIAARYKVAVAYGYPECDGGAVYNSVQLFGPDRASLANYRKTHLCGEFEREHFTYGKDPVVQAELDGVRIGFLICYDVEFPENVRAHALAGTDLLVVPTAVMDPFQIVPESLVPVRAFENQMYIAYANRIGKEQDFEFVGRSTLVGPDGVVRARAGRGAEELIFGDFDPAFLAASRAENPYLRDRRPELYASLTDRARVGM
ncbi:carbon-nitrogen hydrolase family protein [Streptomyces chattanoogensis]|uniref:carbon-nitrogen hydrolase family protein n=1 Tax=Streptomyces chattanoogensis TaxID=66876 RepID=UPI000A7E6D34|nr:carbon-nitrogen hydrolase family protein [Streptomyces chattanoogensis]